MTCARRDGSATQNALNPPPRGKGDTVVDLSVGPHEGGERLDHHPISARIRNALLERIVGGDYAPGVRLVELQLAREFGTSQAPVREALRDLETAGLVTIRPRRGSFVND